MFHIDFRVSEDCINIFSFGEICVHCGCCSRNDNFKDRIISRIRYFKEMLADEYKFSDWDEDEDMRALQKRNHNANILYFKRKMRIYKKILRTMKGEQNETVL